MVAAIDIVLPPEIVTTNINIQIPKIITTVINRTITTIEDPPIDPEVGIVLPPEVVTEAVLDQDHRHVPPEVPEVEVLVVIETNE